MRQDPGRLRPGDETAVDLRTPPAARLDLVDDRTRQTTQIRSHPRRPSGLPAPRGFSYSARC
ncbi:hypothetical protein [Streptomyces caniscabiei]|nr:hypothetical protein [Streptomyces caniscabiei]